MYIFPVQTGIARKTDNYSRPQTHFTCPEKYIKRAHIMYHYNNANYVIIIMDKQDNLTLNLNIKQHDVHRSPTKNYQYAIILDWTSEGHYLEYIYLLM